jgi:hypothetical protein
MDLIVKLSIIGTSIKCHYTIMHLLPSVAIQSNLESKTQPKQLLGSLPLVIVLPGECHYVEYRVFSYCMPNVIMLSVVAPVISPTKVGGYVCL